MNYPSTLKIAIIFLTALVFVVAPNSSWSLSFESKVAVEEKQNTETKERNLLEMLFGAFIEQQESTEDDLGSSEEKKEVHIEDALRSMPDQIPNNQFSEYIENLEGDFANTGYFTIINTITGKVYKEKIKVGEVKQIEKIALKNLSCWDKFEKNILPESRSLIEIYREQKDKSFAKIFYGWLIASSRSASLLNDREYDVILNSCSNN